MNKKRKTMQSGGMVQPVWQDLYGSWLQNQNGQLTNQLPLQGNTLQEVQVTAQSLGQRPPMGYQEPQSLPINNQVQAQPYQQNQLPYQGGYQAPQEDPGMSQQQAGQIGGGIAQGAYAIGDVFDALGGLKKAFIKGGAGILNSLIADNPNERQRATQFADNQNRYGTGYDVLYKNGGTLSADKAKEMLKDGTANGKKLTAKQKRYFGFVAGGGEAKNGATVKEYGFGEQPPMTAAQAAALNQFIPYPAPEQPIPIQQPYQPQYYSALPSGAFQINIPRHLQDRTSRSGRIGADYDQTLTRGFGYEGAYGSRDYIPTMQNGGLMNNTGYLQGYPTAQNPVNVIPSGSITTEGMAFPIMANNTPLYPNTGNYQFPTDQVVESPLNYQVGQELELTKQQIEALRKQGYEFE